MKTILAALALFSATAVSPLLGQGDDESTRMTLAGVHGVRVVVRLSDSAEVQKDGLFQSQLQTDVEIKLRQTGITVLSQQEAQLGPWLNVNVSTLNVSSTSATGMYAVCMTAELHQWVTLTRNPSVRVWVSTWSATGQFGTTAHLSSVRDRIRDMTDQFINAYLAANPKR